MPCHIHKVSQAIAWLRTLCIDIPRSSQCETKSQNVCIDVTETKCEVVPYKECKMGLEPMEYTEKKLAPKLFVEKSCYQGKKTIPHKKLFPECKNVTKQNCVTLWETDENGQQVNIIHQVCKLIHLIRFGLGLISASR